MSDPTIHPEIYYSPLTCTEPGLRHVNSKAPFEVVEDLLASQGLKNASLNNESRLLMEVGDLAELLRQADGLPESIKQAIDNAPIDIYYLMKLLAKTALSLMDATQKERSNSMQLGRASSASAADHLMKSAIARFAADIGGAVLGVAGGVISVHGGILGTKTAVSNAKTAGLSMPGSKPATNRQNPFGGDDHTPMNPLYEPRKKGDTLDDPEANQPKQAAEDTAPDGHDTPLAKYNRLMDRDRPLIEKLQGISHIMESLSRTASAIGNIAATPQEVEKILAEADASAWNTRLGMTNDRIAELRQGLQGLLEKGDGSLKTQQQISDSAASVLNA